MNFLSLKSNRSGNTMGENLKMIDLFSGGGGFSYAAEKLVGGYETIQFVENEAYCQKVLKKHWPLVPIHDDIRTYKPEPYSADVVVGGFPCTDISTAGKGLGITKETRSGLFYELMRVVCVVRPKYVILENVAAILNNGLGIVLGELSKGGFDAEWGTFRASDYVRAAHHRDRWWLIATNRDFADPNSNGYNRRWAETRNQNAAGENSQIIWPTNTGDFKRQSNDESNQGQSRVNENISESPDTGKTTSSKSGGVCDISKETNNDQGTGSQNKNQKNKDRTLVSEGQSGVQLSQHRRLGSDKTTSEGYSIRQGNDNSESKGVDFQKSNTANTESERLQGGMRNSEGEGWEVLSSEQHDRNEIWSEARRIDGISSKKKSGARWRNTKHLLNPNWKEYGVEPAICGDADGPASELFANRAARLKLLGNGLEPQCAAIPLQRVLDLENES